MSNSPLSEAFVELAVTTRSGHDESVHYGTVVGLAPDGSVEFALGDPSAIVFPRSSTKPIQATAMVVSGLDLPPHLLALVCASHDGRPEHLRAATDILSQAGLTEHDLLNTADYPLDPDAHEAVVRGGGVKTSLQMNCSGKHSGMLATCVHNRWDLDPEAEVTFSASFPGEVVSTNGERINTDYVVWQLKPGTVTTMSAQSRFTDPSTRSFAAAALWLGLAACLVAGIVAALAWRDRDQTSPRFTEVESDESPRDADLQIQREKGAPH